MLRRAGTDPRFDGWEGLDWATRCNQPVDETWVIPEPQLGEMRVHMCRRHYEPLSRYLMRALGVVDFDYTL